MTKNEQIIIGSDHAGFALKEHLKQVLKNLNVEFLDVGATSGKLAVDYPIYISKVASAVSNGEFERGIAIDGTGIGSSILANRYPHVRAAICMNSDMARIARAHSDSNILVLGSWMTSHWSAEEILKEWLKTKFEGGRHARRIGLINDQRRLDVALDHLNSIEPEMLKKEEIDDRMVNKVEKGLERLIKLFWNDERRGMSELRQPATYLTSVTRGNEKFSALMIDFSKEGAQFKPTSAAKKITLKTGDALEMEVKTPYGSGRCGAVVMWVDHSFYTSFGVKFTQLSSDKKDPLRCLLEGL
jgi:ribose 5-phosphate isomerase B